MGWLPNLDELKKKSKNGTKLIFPVNPKNPTAARIPPEILEEIANIAGEADVCVLCDEVYRVTDQQDQGMTISMADIYKKGISAAGILRPLVLQGEG